MRARRMCEWSILVSLLLSIFIPVSASAPDIVLYASDATTVQAAWSKTSGSGVAGGQYLSTFDNGWSSANSPLASPDDWFEATFTAPANTPYHVWLRLRATADTKYNDSVWVQFNDATDPNGAALYQIGSANALLINLENCYGCGVAGWGWQDKSYWLSQVSTIAFAASGSHTIRVQTREDGVQIDQIVLSPSTYLWSAPGQAMNDTTIVAKPAAPTPAPFYGTPAAIPGTIEAEDFDHGGEGLAYHDSTAGNSGGVYRQDDVDLEPSSDGGNDVGWTTAGEWLNYTVNVAAAGSYVVTFRVASNGQGGSFHLDMNGTNVSGALTIPNTGAWQNWQTITKTVTLGTGQQVARLVMDSAGDSGSVGNIESIAFAAAPSAPAGEPYTGTAAAIPGEIASAYFDNGGEGVAYHDTTAGNTGTVCRTTDVDLQASSDGGYGIGWIAAGEWVNYTVNVTSAGSYTARFRVASPNGGASLRLGFNGNNVWTPVSVPATGGYQTWTTVTVPVTLTAGQQIMTLRFDTKGFNLTSVTFVTDAPLPPGAPDLPSSPSVADSSVGVTITPNLSWQAAGATSYDLRFDTINPPSGVLAPGLSTNSYAVSGLSSATKYYWQVVAKNSSGSTTGPVWSFTTEGASPPTAGLPAMPTTAAVSGQVDVTISPALSWQSAGATSFDLRFSASNPPAAFATGLARLYYEASGLSYGTTYYWQVVARNSAGSTTGPVWSFTTEGASTTAALPAVPTTAVVSGQVEVTVSPTLSWQSAGATSFDLRFSASNPPAAFATGLTRLYYEASGLSYGTTYYWQVVAKNSAGSTAGPVWSFTTLGGLPAAPNSPNVADGSVSVTITPNLSWQAAGATSYDVRFDTSNPPSGVGASGLSTNSYAPSALRSATKYYWQVVARNSAGSTAGPVWSFTTAGSTSSSSFRMMTWNIHHGFSTANVYNLLAQVQLMVAQNPDVIALQEVQTWDENQPPKLKSLLEQLTGQTWTLVWAPVTNSAGTEGNVLLTRLPVVTSTYQQLHATSDWTVLLANRSVAQATVLVNSVPVNVFATHLDYANTSYRTVQEQQLMSWLWNFSGPRLTGGDFNSWWGEYWITTMKTQHTDTWRDVTGINDLGYTVEQVVRFDYVFRSIDSNWRVTPTNCFVPVTYLSDHNPVVADFTVQ